jgi:cytochrome b
LRIKVWDRPTRLFHWLLVVLVPLQWWTAEEEMIEIHMMLGRVMLGLILFRLLWGLIGSSTARFAGFVRGPRAVLSYLRGRTAPLVGHNPLGALSVIALLLLLAVQVALGLFASDEDGLYAGPLADLVGEEASETLAERHEDMFDVLLVFIGLHVAAIVYYTWFRRQDLVGPMVTGRGEAPEGAEPMRTASAWRFVVAAVLAGAVALGIGWVG